MSSCDIDVSTTPGSFFEHETVKDPEIIISISRKSVFLTIFTFQKTSGNVTVNISQIQIYSNDAHLKLTAKKFKVILCARFTR